MGCGCSKRKKVIDVTEAVTAGGGQFEVEAPDGTRETHPSYLEAAAAAAPINGKVRPAS